MTDRLFDALGVFLREEAAELLAQLEAAILELETRPGDGEAVGRAFRALHTLKGNAGMFGLDEAEAFAHQVESAFAEVRDGLRGIDPGILDAALEARDVLGALVGLTPRPADLEARRETVLERLATRTVQGRPDRTPPPGPPPGETVYRIRFIPGPEILATGTDPLRLLGELGRLGDATVVAHADRLPPLDAMDPESCYLWWDVVLRTARGEAEIREVFAFVAGRAEVSVERVDPGDPAAGPGRIGEILVDRGDLSRGELDRLLAGHTRFGEALVRDRIVDGGRLEAALAEQEAIRRAQSLLASEAAASSVRVQTGKLDALVDLVGEMVTVQSRLTRTAGLIGSPELTAVAEEIERLTAQLRETAFGIRMIPFSTAFGKFRRLVRDLCRETGKQVELETAGGETELDKTVMEKLNDPIVHLIRNGIDHGVEDPAARERAGKPRAGRLLVSAARSGPDVLVTVADDGAGLDEEAIARRAVSLGLLEEGTAPGRRELHQLILSPGFSTSGTVTSVSGRGVGLDVVKRSVESLRGSLAIDSRPGTGTTFTIRLPLTLAIIEGLQVTAGGERFILPLAQVEECVELTEAHIRSFGGRDLSRVRGETVPYVRLRDWLHIPGVRPPIEQVVVTRVDGRRVGIAVDQVLGEQQTVIKSLGRFYRETPGFSAATILGDGRIALILDVEQLVRDVERTG